MIQLIKNASGERMSTIEVNNLSNPKSLDQYDINIIDLNDKQIWRNTSDSYAKINSENDFKSLGTMLNNSEKAINIIVLPKDDFFEYDYRDPNYGHRKSYQEKIRLKDMIPNLKNKILKDILILQYDLLFENTFTTINKQEIKSSFYFKDVPKEASITKSVGSNKVTTFSVKKNLFVTTLELNSLEHIENFLDFLGLGNKKEEIPDWINDINFFNDSDQKETISNSQEKITKLEEVISLSTNQLEENLKYKSILYTNGDELVKVVFDILTIMLSYDLNSFIDEKKEDFIIKLDDLTLIGEIKGVNSSIKSGHISQLDVHYQGYLDSLAEIEQNEVEVVKSILIINHQRNKNIIDRISVHEKQKGLAKRNGSLIIETTTLLKLFEKFKRTELSVEEFKDLIKNKCGLLEI